MGQGDGRRLEQGAPGRAGQGPGDPDRQELRGGHRRRDHRRQRALPGASTPRRRRCRGFQKQGGLVALDDLPGGKEYVEARTGEAAQAVRLAGRQVLPAAVEVQPGDDLLQQEALREGRPRPENPPLPTYEEFLRHVAQARVKSGAVDAAIHPAPSSEFYQSWFDFYPLFVAESGKQLVEDGKAAVQLAGGPAGRRVLEDDVQRAAGAEREVQRRRVRRREGGDGDRRPVGGRGLRRQGRLGRRARADLRGQARRAGPDVLRREVGRDVQRVQEPRHGVGRPEVRDLRGAGRRVPARPPARCRCAPTCPAPTRTTSPSATSTRRSPSRPRGSSRSRTSPNSVTIWQTFRDAYSKSVIFGKEAPQQAFGEAAGKVDGPGGGRRLR